MRIQLRAFALTLFFASSACNCSAASDATEYLSDLGVSFYKLGRLAEARHEFSKVLLLDPTNGTASKYILSIDQQLKTKEQKTLPAVRPSVPAGMPLSQSPAPIAKQRIPVPPKPAATPAHISFNTSQEAKPAAQFDPRKNAMEQALYGSSSAAVEVSQTKKIALMQALDSQEAAIQSQAAEPPEPEQEAKKPVDKKISGDIQLGLGITSHDLIWKRANRDLNEENFRLLSHDALNLGMNTYDPRIFDRLKVVADSGKDQDLNFHANLTVDPWSFTGKSEKVTVRGNTWNDTADIQLKYWSNSGYTVNDIVYTGITGDSMALPELKVKHGKTDPVRVSSSFGNVYDIPSQNIHRQFQPVRELWMDYKTDNTKVRLFPIAYQNQALSSDDPLKLSNNHMWWQESPWLWNWRQGNYNSGGNPPDFTKGKWDNSIAFLAGDSDGTRLTALRGFSLDYFPDDRLSLASTFATPKDPWQDYDNANNIEGATRAKYLLTDNLQIGATNTYRSGFVKQEQDVFNSVTAIDTSYQPSEGMRFDLQASTSYNEQDMTSDVYKSNQHDNAYYASLYGTGPAKNLMQGKFGYDGVKPEKGDRNFYKFKVYFAHMGEDFKTALSNYRQTRDDTFWSRHLHFRQPLQYYYAGLYESPIGWDDIAGYRLGNGIDAGRNTGGFRLENEFIDTGASNLFDLRNVHDTNGKFLENIVRDELAYKITEKLKSKVMGIYHKLPDTVNRKDPFIFDNNTGIYFNNDAIKGGEDVSLKTGSLGMEYAFSEAVKLSGVWELTNDYNLGNGSFPRGTFNGSSFTTFIDNGLIYRRSDPFMYGQNSFPKPPYDYYNIYKAGLQIIPLENMEIYLDYTINEYKSAGQIDDNMNHIGLEFSYSPIKKLGFYFRYTYAKLNDLIKLINNEEEFGWHHNFATEVRYRPSADDEVVMQYGESGRGPATSVTYDPFGGSLPTLDTTHIVRLYYRRKF